MVTLTVTIKGMPPRCCSISASGGKTTSAATNRIRRLGECITRYWTQQWHRPDRYHFIGSSDGGSISGDDEPAFMPPWCEKVSLRLRTSQRRVSLILLWILDDPFWIKCRNQRIGQGQRLRKA